MYRVIVLIVQQASDAASTTRLVKEICELCYQARDYALLNSGIQNLSKKHGQLKVSIQAMVEQAMGWLNEIREREGDEKWLELIETLRSVTEGKVRFVLDVHDCKHNSVHRSFWRRHAHASHSS